VANPRKTIDYRDIGAPSKLLPFTGDLDITFDRTLPGGSAQIGLCVKVSASKTVALVGDGEGIAGTIDHVEPDGTVVVHLGPVISVPGGTGATLTPGSRIVGDLGPSNAKGYARSVAAATLAEVAVARGEILDVTDTDAVQVWMGD
jgi:hypothetical protein